MIEIPLGAPALGALRFTADPLWEVANGLVMKYQPCRQRSWLHRRFLSAPGWAEVAPAHLDLVAAALADPTFVPDLLTPEPTIPWSGSSRPARERVEDVHGVDLLRAAEDLSRISAGPGAAAVAGWSPERLRSALGDAVTAVWDAVLAPWWPRMADLLAADIAHRSGTVARHGVLAALDELDPRVGVRGDVLEVHLTDVSGQAEPGPLWLVPSVLAYPGVLVSWGGSATVIGYGARGSGRLWESESAPQQPDALSGLMGRTRAGLLVVLDVPRTTSDLAAGQSLALGTVSGHLQALTAAGLVAAHREGRRVLYARTALGDALVDSAG